MCVSLCVRQSKLIPINAKFDNLLTVKTVAKKVSPSLSIVCTVAAISVRRLIATTKEICRNYSSRKTKRNIHKKMHLKSHCIIQTKKPDSKHKSRHKLFIIILSCGKVLNKYCKNTVQNLKILSIDKASAALSYCYYCKSQL